MIENLHSLLNRQIKKYLNQAENLRVQHENFLQAVSDTYHSFDEERKLIERSLELSSQELMQRNSEMQTVFQALPDVFLRLDSEGRILSYKFSPNQFYVPPDRIIGQLLPNLHEGPTRALFESTIRELPQKQTMISIEYALKNHDRVAFYEARFQPFLDHQIIVLIRDISDYKRVMEELRESEHRYAIAAEGANDGLWDWNLKTNQIYYSTRWKSLIGFKDHEISTSPDEWFRRIHADDFTAVKRLLDGQKERTESGHLEIEYRILHKDGSYRWVLTRGIAVCTNGQKAVDRMAGSQTDITKNKTAEEQLRYDAFHDKLTGLPNRKLFLDRLSNVIERNKRHPDMLFAVLFIDLDRFKVVNDSLGHIAGDQLLVEVSHILKSSTRSGDTVARLGGDEFTILLEDISDVATVINYAERIQKAISVPVDLQGQQVFVTASIGITLNSISKSNLPATLLRDADTAMYHAKMEGKARYVLFRGEMHVTASARLQLESELRHAQENNELELYYQPIFSIPEQKIVRLEALLRWNHPRRGIVPPLEFIPLAEETGIIINVGEWVIQQVCRQSQMWKQKGLPYVELAFNCSARQFQHKYFYELIKEAVESCKIEALTLELEITESVAMSDIGFTSKLLSRLRELGIKIAIDDFGIGYSSLSCLKYFPLNVLKIDKAFINGIPQNRDNAAISTAVIALGHGLGLTIVGEGVETVEQLAFLSQYNCDEVQGFLFSRPVPATQIEQLLWKYNTAIKYFDLLKEEDIRREIDRYKWLESEKAGRDIGLEKASKEWLDLYANTWLKQHPQRHLNS